MTLLGRAVDAIVQRAADRPVPSRFGGFTGFGISGAVGQPTARAGLAAYTSVGWLFAVVSRISVGVASVEWKAYQKHSNGERTELAPEHPANMIWMRPNPFSSRTAFVEAGQQHQELAGETFILMVGNGAKPDELWTLRPDYMKPVASEKNWLDGWWYEVSGHKVFLPHEDVIQLKFPSPISEFRGVGPIAAIHEDIAAENDASKFNSNSFKNGAQPGGIIQMREGAQELDDAQFRTFTERWRQQHQGVSNANRIAVLESGMEWVDRKFSNRDLQLDQIRKTNRDIIFGAWGISSSIMGVTEDVNRANAEAAEVHFQRWLINPRLVRYKEALNHRLAPFFGTGIEYDFEDPVPSNREIEIREAEVGFETRSLTTNEIRRRLHEDELEDGTGDELPTAPEPAAAPSLEQFEAAGYLPEPRRRVFALSADDADIRPATVDQLEDEQRKAWEKRLSAEADALALYIEPFMQRQFRNGKFVETKIELTDLDGYDWDWWAKYGDDVVDELEQVFAAAMLAELPGMPAEELQRLSAQYAAQRGADLLKVDGTVSLVVQTKESVRQLTAAAIERGASLTELQKELREAHAFSKARATSVARTETATALGQGQKQTALEQGRDEKKWVTQGDSRVSTTICAPNSDQGWIPVQDVFQSGAETIPGHVQCFIPTTQVRGAFVGGLKAWYAGKVVEITTKAGKRLTVTPNHPVLTAEGFSAAGDLHKGDRLVTYRDEVEGPNPEDDEKDVPPMIAQVFESLAAGGTRSLIDPVSTYLHGDAAGMDSQIEIVGTLGVLAIDNVADLTQRIAEFDLASADVGLSHEPSSGTALSSLWRVDPSATRIPGGSQLAIHVDGPATPFEEFGLTAPAYWDVTLSEAAGENRAADARFVAQLFERHPSQVAIDQIIEIRNYEFRGHVYDLQATGGWMVAEGIIASNCRCNVIYRTAPVPGEASVGDGHAHARGVALLAEFRCEKCNRLLDKDVQPGTKHWCRTCKTERTVPGEIVVVRRERFDHNDYGQLVGREIYEVR